MSKPGQYDESPELVRAIQDKFREKALRKAHYQKMMSDPYRWAFQAAPVDLGILRFEATRTLSGAYPFFRPTPSNFMWYFCSIWLPIIGFSVLVKRSNEKREKLLRSGTIAYRDRDNICT